MRVLIVDDSAFMRKAIRQMLETDDDVEVVGSARNGKEGVELCKQLRPDVVTMDVEMPEMDGITALRHIMTDCPTSVLMVSSLTTEGSRAALAALRHGAADILAKDQSQISIDVRKLEAELLTRVRALAGPHALKRRPRLDSFAGSASDAAPALRPSNFDCLCIGSSTGGPPVLEKIVAALPADYPHPVVIAQHMPALFTKSMAERLDEMCRLEVRHAESGDELKRRTVYVAPGGHNIHIKKTGLARRRLIVNDEPQGAIYKPSVDALLGSAAEALGRRCLAVVLTGMGDDGLRGARLLHEKGGVILAQNQETCVVYGMPKAVTQDGLVAASLAPDAIAKLLAGFAPSVAAAASEPAA